MFKNLGTSWFVNNHVKKITLNFKTKDFKDFKTKIFVILFSCKLLNSVILDEGLYLSKFNDINDLEDHLISRVKIAFIVHNYYDVLYVIKIFSFLTFFPFCVLY